MRTKIYIYIVAFLVMGMSVGIILGVNYLSGQCRRKKLWYWKSRLWKQ